MKTEQFTVEELIMALIRMTGKNQQVWVATDEEGNDFSPVRKIIRSTGHQTAAGDTVKGIIIYP